MSEQLNTTKTFHYDASISGIPNVTIKYPSGHQLFDEHPDDEVCFPEMGLLNLCLGIAVLDYPCRWPPELAKHVWSYLWMKIIDFSGEYKNLLEEEMQPEVLAWKNGEIPVLSEPVEEFLREAEDVQKRLHAAIEEAGQDFPSFWHRLAFYHRRKIPNLPECNGKLPAIRLKYDLQTFYTFVG